jgi:uncharacterized protein YecE (DUF72 family)
MVGPPPPRLERDAAPADGPGRSAPAAPPADQLSIFGGDAPARAPVRRTTRAAPILAAPAPLALPGPLERFRGRLRLGTSSWSFPGWQGLVYDDPGAPYAESRLSREGLPAYASHSLLGAVGIDRSFYAPIPTDEYARYAAQVPAGFRFLVKAPALVTDAVRRDEGGRGRAQNPGYLDAETAIATFVRPALEGLGDRLGTLLFQFSPLPGPVLSDPPSWIARLRAFLAALPRPLPQGADYAVELRDPALLTPRLIDALRDTGVEYCIALHDRMPPVQRQLRALQRLHPAGDGPLLVRWTLHAGIGYEAAKQRYAPFRELADPDPATRGPLAAQAAATLLAGHAVTVIANNKAEGSAPLTLVELARAIAQDVGAAADAIRLRPA